MPKISGEIEKKILFCQKQAEHFLGLFKGRREFEWKVTLTFWATLVASATIIKAIKDNIFLLYILGFSFIVFWIRGIYVANKNDKDQAFHFLNQARLLAIGTKKEITDYSFESLGVTPRNRKCEYYFGFLTCWSNLFQTIFTIMIIIVLHLYSQT